MPEKSNGKKSNRLVHEKSPYLLQHAYNPVDWFPWSEEAFEKAKTEDKPIFLSIGYSTCHWCHVMEHESFEDNQVANLMNEAFVSIKVDREERPDIDKVYMQVAQMMTGGGGWPLTIIMTPNKDPFFAATYIPKESRYGQLGMLQLIPRIQDIWKKDRDNIKNIIRQIKDALTEGQTRAGELELDMDAIESAFTSLSRRFDDKNGGFGSAPKFPSPHNLLFLLRYWKRTGDKWALHMVEQTLQKMRIGGVYDHIGFGFHRYSTDSTWLLPHFEKMLYDQAMIALAYAEIYQATKKPEYADAVREIFTYVLRDMTHPEGAFYSAEDADSEGEEGKFYVWSFDEVKELLSDEQIEPFVKAFNLRPEGNFKDEATRKATGLNIPHRTQSVDEIGKSLNIKLESLENLLNRAREKLFDKRAKRVRPLRDDKILTDWNGLMIAALSYGGRVLDEPEYIKSAEKAAEFILKYMRNDDGLLFHRFRESEITVEGFLDDYAFMIWGLIELYEATLNPTYLELALEINEKQTQLFWDNEQGAFYFTSAESEKLLVRQKEAYDGAIPSGNSISMYNQIRLSHLLGNAELEQKSSEISKAFSSDVQRSPTGFTMMLAALDFALGPSIEVVIAGTPDSDDTKEMLEAINKQYIPNMVVLLRSGEDMTTKLDKLAPYTEYYNIVDDKATAHVCIDYNCKLPTNSTAKMLSLLGVESNDI